QNYEVQFKSGNYTPVQVSWNQVSPAGSEVVNGHYYRYIQFKQIPSDEQKAQLARAGVQLYNYVPGYTYMASIPAGLNLASVDDGNIRAVFPVAEQFKLSAELWTRQYPEWAMRGK